jgi:hypothetical protein
LEQRGVLGWAGEMRLDVGPGCSSCRLVCGEGVPRRGRDTAANGCRRPLASDTSWEEDFLELGLLHRECKQQEWWLRER